MLICQVEIADKLHILQKEENMTFAEKIRRQRKDRDMGQKEFAEYIGVSLRTLSDYENSKARPRTRDAYQRIAATLDVNINYLLNEDDDFIITSGELFGYKGKNKRD